MPREPTQAWFGLLGPLYVLQGEVEVVVSAARHRVLLAALLIRVGRVLSVDELAEAVWDGEPPDKAQVTLRSYVKRLRQVLGPALGARIVTRDPGYLIDANAAEVDVSQFEVLCRAGRRASDAGAWQKASDLLTEALGLWRGAPLADIRSQVLQRLEVPRLERLRLEATEWQIEAGLSLGHHGQLVPDLQALVAEHPLRERFHAQLMLALHRCGRHAEALAIYRQSRGILVAEVGIEPGPELQQLHQRILAHDPSLAAPPLHMPAAVPQQLPATAPHFAGRTAELEKLASQLDSAVAHGTVVITMVCGMAGVGKTALAVEWAHQVAGRFPDGQLYVNLRGFDPAAVPLAPEQALRGFLEALEVAPEKIPVTPQAQAGLYRSLLADKKALILLDNARDEQQVRPLLPASPTCLVLITSRSPLAGLAAANGAKLLSLDVFTSDEARQLLARRLGGPRVLAEPQAIAELIGLCGRLPLALAITAAQADAHPDRSLATIAAELGNLHQRLATLDTGDAATSIRAVFSWSCRGLSPAAGRMFRLLSLHPGPDITVAAAASLAGLPLVQVSELLSELTRAGLLNEHAPGRFIFHDLLRAYAAEQAHACDTEQERRTALTSLFGYYLAAAAVATAAVFPEGPRAEARPPTSDLPMPPAGIAGGLGWLDAERATLVALTELAASAWPGHAIRLAASVFSYLEAGAHFHDAQAIGAAALHAARHANDSPAQADCLKDLARIDMRQGNIEQAADRARTAQQIYLDIRDRCGQAQALVILAHVDWCQGWLPRSANRLRHALAMFRETGDPTGESKALANLGLVVCTQGCYDEAYGYQCEALTISRQVGDRAGEALALCLLGMTMRRQGRSQQAIAHISRSLVIYRNLGNPGGEADALYQLGRTFQAQARHWEAVRHYRQACAIFRDTGNPGAEVEPLNGLGEALLGADLPELARAHYLNALTLARKFGPAHEWARAHDGLARTYHATGDHSQAHRHWQHALSLYTRLGLPETDEIKQARS